MTLMTVVTELRPVIFSIVFSVPLFSRDKNSYKSINTKYWNNLNSEAIFELLCHKVLSHSLGKTKHYQCSAFMEININYFVEGKLM